MEFAQGFVLGEFDNPDKGVLEAPLNSVAPLECCLLRGGGTYQFDNHPCLGWWHGRCRK
jgi:hypothetical protein